MPYKPRSGLRLSVQYRVDAKDSIGANVPTWPDRLTNIPCDRAPLGSQMAADFGRPDLVGTVAIYTNQDIAATSNERIVIGGVNYLVAGYMPFESPFTRTKIYVTLTKKRNQ
jgi:hypothetical protein